MLGRHTISRSSGLLRLLTRNCKTTGSLRCALTGNSEAGGHGSCALLAILGCLRLLRSRFCLLSLLSLLLCLVNSGILLIVMLHQIHQGHRLFVRISRSRGFLRLLGLLTRNCKTTGSLSRLGLLRFRRLLRRSISSLRNHRLPVLHRPRCGLRCRLRHRLRCRLRHRLRCGLRHRLRCGLGYGLRCGLRHGLCRTSLIDAVQQSLEINQRQIGRAVQIV